jgi:hypothetical protein
MALSSLILAVENFIIYISLVRVVMLLSVSLSLQACFFRGSSSQHVISQHNSEYTGNATATLNNIQSTDQSKTITGAESSSGWLWYQIPDQCSIPVPKSHQPKSSIVINSPLPYTILPRLFLKQLTPDEDWGLDDAYHSSDVIKLLTFVELFEIQTSWRSLSCRGLIFDEQLRMVLILRWMSNSR